MSSRALPQLQRIRGTGRAFTTPPRPLEWGTWGAGDPTLDGKIGSSPVISKQVKETSWRVGEGDRKGQRPPPLAL